MKTMIRCLVIAFTFGLSTHSNAVTNSLLRLTSPSTAYITVPDNSNLQLVNTDYSVTGWLRLNQYDPWGSSIIAKRSTGSKRGYLFQVAGTNQGAEAKTLSFGVSEGADPRIFSSSAFPTGTWHHVTMTFVYSTLTAKLYVDGYCDAIATLPSPLVSTSALYIGRDSKQSQYQFKGDLDNLQIWTKALTPAEVRSNMTQRLTGLEPNLAAFWNFDDGTASDESLGGHNGTLQGGAVVQVEPPPTVSENWAVEIPFQSGSPLNRYRLQYSLDASSTNWFGIGESLLGNEKMQSFYDSAPQSPQRFYRVIQE